MDENEFQAYCNDRYNKAVEWYDKKSVSNQKKYRRLQWALIVFSALTPALIAIQLNISKHPELVWIPILSSIIVAILASALKAFKFQENWINYRTTCETLRKEIHYYKARIGDYANSDDPEALFVERVEGLISRENTLWIIAQKRIDESKH